MKTSDFYNIMFQLKGRVTSLTYSEEPRNVLNQQLQELQEKEGVIFTSIKQAFEHLLSKCLQDENNEIEQGMQVVSDDFISLSNDYKSFADKVHKILSDGNENTRFTDVEVLSEISSLIENNKKTPETITENETVEIERPLSDNEILLSLSEPVQTKKDIIQLIQNNRAKKTGKEMESTSQICEGLIFSESALCNWADDFFTGIASKRKLQKNIKK